MIPPVDLTKLPAAAQKVLDPAAPAPMRGMAAKGIVPGLKPVDLITIIVVLAEGADAVAETARQTLAKLPAPVLNGALGGDLDPLVLDRLVPGYLGDAAIM